MIFEQLDTEFTTDDYNDIKKVYSIWICMNSPNKYAGTISEYSMAERSLVGEFSGQELNMKMTNEMEGAMSHMCNLSEAIVEETAKRVAKEVKNR